MVLTSALTEVRTHSRKGTSPLEAKVLTLILQWFLKLLKWVVAAQEVPAALHLEVNLWRKGERCRLQRGLSVVCNAFEQYSELCLQNTAILAACMM